MQDQDKRIELGDQLDPGNAFLLLAEWAPVGNAIAFVYKNNIFYKPTVDSNTIINITTDGGFVNNGIPDWVYEEEVLSSNKALWFSPDGTKLAFGKFDDSDVQLMVLPIYGEPGNLIFQYPRATVIKYPKVGTPNPTVSLHCVDLTTEGTPTPITLEPPSSFTQNE